MELIFDRIRDEAQDRANEMMSIDEDHPNYATAYDHAFHIAVSDIVDHIMNHFNVE